MNFKCSKTLPMALHMDAQDLCHCASLTLATKFFLVDWQVLFLYLWIFPQ